ncbi:MAG TPA: RidA family protein [Lacibacter sp.]|nr:RidA family protein [Lacibacter sp.]HMO88226.1 RidA family protein [Lacibacter sp.]HMP88275.1 RidA family protein [Lacibacter sp.]
MRYYFLLCLCLTASFFVKAQQKAHLNPNGVNKPKTYSQVVKVRGGEWVITSGIVADDAQGAIVGKGDLRQQTRQCFENLKIVLAAAGASFSDVVKMNYYVVNYRPEQVTLIREVRSGYLPTENPPASTLVGIHSLFHPDVLIEIEAVAVVKKKKKR